MRVVFHRLAPRLRPSRSRLTALITAIGISLLLENQGQAVLGATPRAYYAFSFQTIWYSDSRHLLDRFLGLSVPR